MPEIQIDCTAAKTAAGSAPVREAFNGAIDRELHQVDASGGGFSQIGTAGGGFSQIGTTGGGFSQTTVAPGEA